jgi:hypothetical protein
MGLFKSSEKKRKSEEPPLKKVNIAELLEESEQSKEIQSIEIPVGKDFSSASQQNPEKEYLTGVNETYKQIFDKEGLDETKEFPKNLIVDEENTSENTQSVLVFGVAGSGKTGSFNPIDSGVVLPELETELENSSEDKEEIVEENLEDGEDMKIETIQVPRAFNDWHEQADKTKSVFEVYAEIEASENEKLIAWVRNNQNEFAKIWLGALIPELEIQYYITKIANYDQVSPNLLVRTAEGQYMVKTNADILDTDVTKLTEEEIRKDWGYLFENGFSELVED